MSSPWRLAVHALTIVIFAVGSSHASLHDAIFVARSNGEVDQISAGGAITPIATGFGFAQALDFDANGNLLVGCRTGMVNQDSIRKIAPNGAVSPFVSGLNDLAQMTFDASGNLYYSSEGAGKISKITPQGVVSPYATIPQEAEGLVFDSQGNLFVATLDGDVYKISPGKTVTPFAQTRSLELSGLEIDASGNLFATGVGVLWKITPAGVVSFFADAEPSPTFNWQGLALDSGGDFLVADLSRPGLLDISPSAHVTTLASLQFVTDVATLAPEPTGLVFIALAVGASLRRARIGDIQHLPAVGSKR